MLRPFQRVSRILKHCCEKSDWTETNISVSSDLRRPIGDPKPTHFEYTSVCPPFVNAKGERFDRCFSNSCCHPPSGTIPVEIGMLSRLRDLHLRKLD